MRIVENFPSASSSRYQNILCNCLFDDWEFFCRFLLIYTRWILYFLAVYTIANRMRKWSSVTVFYVFLFLFIFYLFIIF